MKLSNKDVLIYLSEYFEKPPSMKDFTTFLYEASGKQIDKITIRTFLWTMLASGKLSFDSNWMLIIPYKS